MKKSLKLTKGNRVRISKKSEYYRNVNQGGISSNPLGVTGTIERVDPKESYCYRVKWDNGENNAYREGDLYIFEDGCDVELTVSKEFLLEAHKAACSDWKQRLEEEFPEVFETDKYPTLIELKRGEQLNGASLYVQIVNADGDREYVQLNGIEIVDGIADGRILPVQARYKALYIRPELLGFGDYEIKHKVSDKDRGDSGSHVVYFEKK
jgi:hypothetical protein